MIPKPAFGRRVVFCGSMRKDILWPAATCLAVALAMEAAVSLRGQHSEAEGGGKLGEVREALRQEAASPYRWCDLGEALLEAGQKEKATTASNRLSNLRRIFHPSG
jgi:hypothetical protein